MVCSSVYAAAGVSTVSSSRSLSDLFSMTRYAAVTSREGGVAPDPGAADFKFPGWLATGKDDRRKYPDHQKLREIAHVRHSVSRGSAGGLSESGSG